MQYKIVIGEQQSKLTPVKLCTDRERTYSFALLLVLIICPGIILPSVSIPDGHMGGVMTIRIPSRDRSGLVSRLPSIIIILIILITLEVVAAELLAKTLLLVE